MATYDQRIEDWPIPAGTRRPMTYVPHSSKPTTRDIIRRRTTRHDPQTPLQLAYRAVFKFATFQWKLLTPEQKELWHDYYYLNFFGQAVHRWLAMQAPAATPITEEDPSPITLTNVAPIAIPKGIALTFTPTTAVDLWGVAILRSLTQITTPDPLTAIFLYPTTSTTPRIYTDTPLPAATQHYRAAALEHTGRIGPFSTDVFATPL